MKINSQILSIPPHILTSWENVSGLYIQDEKLFIVLNNGKTVSIENLSSNTIQTVYRTYESFLEKRANTPQDTASTSTTSTFGALTSDFPIQLGIGSLDNLGNAMQHMQH